MRISKLQYGAGVNRENMDSKEKHFILEAEVIYENKDFLAINKPSGMLTHTDNSKIKEQNSKLRWPTLTSWLLEKYPAIRGVGDDPATRPGIVHRLDKDTSGVILVARTQEYFDYLKKLFQEHTIKKTYVALVYGTPKEKKGVIDKPIALKAGTTKRSVHGGKMEKEAITEYEVEKIFNFQSSIFKSKPEIKSQKISFLKVWPKTGRTHQIRVHLASIGCPVLNDVIYARKKEKMGSGRLMLHALSLEFTNQEGKKIFIESEVPKEFEISKNDTR